MRHQRVGERVGGPLQRPPHQIDAADDVAPLVAAAELQRAVVPPGKLQIVVGLQQHVAELGVGDAAALPRQPFAHRVPLHHGVDGEVLAHVPQEGNHAQAFGPVEVVHHPTAAAVVQVDEPRRLFRQRRHVAAHRLFVVQGAFLGAARRIADEPGGAAEQQDRPVAAELEAAQHQQRDEIADLEAGRRRVEAGVDDARAASQVRRQGFRRGDLGHEIALFEFAEHGGGAPRRRTVREGRRA